MIYNLNWLMLLCSTIIYPSTIVGQNYLSHNNYKYKVSNQVYNNIVFAFGEGRTPPLFEINPNSLKKKVIIRYYPGENPLIVMDEAVYDLCVKFGADSLNSLAALIGHELAHFYERHDWCSNFAYLLGPDDELGKKIKQIGKEQKLKIEADADYFGGFYGYVAGYGTFNIASKLLDVIYSHYELPEEIKGYPSKAERKNIAVSSLKKIEEWIAVFDVAEFLFVLKEYEYSSICFDYLSKKFPSREILNNAGVCRALHAIEYMQQSELPFVLPIEFDAKTRLKIGISRGADVTTEEREKIINKLHNEALKYFENAKDRDPDYLNAQVNLSCSYLLLKNYHMAIGLSDKIINNNKFANQKYSLSKAYTVRGIAYHYKNEAELARKDFEKAKELSSRPRIKYNLDAFEKLNKGIWDKYFEQLLINFYEPKKENQFGPEKSLNPDNEKIGGKAASGISLKEKGKLINIHNSPLLKMRFEKNNFFDKLFFSTNTENISLLYTKTGYGLTTYNRIRHSSISKQVKIQYGEPTYSVDVLQGQYLVYKKTRIVFLVNHSGLVKKWFIYNRF